MDYILTCSYSLEVYLLKEILNIGLGRGKQDIVLCASFSTRDYFFHSDAANSIYVSVYANF